VPGWRIFHSIWNSGISLPSRGEIAFVYLLAQVVIGSGQHLRKQRKQRNHHVMRQKQKAVEKETKQANLICAMKIMSSKKDLEWDDLQISALSEK
jgi:hypothetical protein